MLDELEFNGEEMELELIDADNSILEAVINGDFDSVLEMMAQVNDLNDLQYYEGIFGGGTKIEELDNYVSDNPADPMNDALNIWEYQGDTGRCGQFAQMFIIEEFLGIDLDPDEFATFSEQMGWFSEEIGTTPENLNKMLDYFGIENEMSQGNSFDDLLDCLNDGGRAVIALDSGEIWDGEGFWDDLFDPNGADHAVEVIGYDPETDCVILNDSGNPNGCGEMIPRDVFVDAWEDSGTIMVECYNG